MKVQTEKCPHCGAAMNKYWHKLTPGLVKTLIEVYKHVSASGENKVSKKELKLNHSQYGNFQKLRFHALIAKYKVNGEWHKGEWLITQRGADFLKCTIQIPEKVQTFRNRVEDHSPELVTVADVMRSDPYWQTDFKTDTDIFAPKQVSLL